MGDLPSSPLRVQQGFEPSCSLLAAPIPGALRKLYYLLSYGGNGSKQGKICVRRMSIACSSNCAVYASVYGEGRFVSFLSLLPYHNWAYRQQAVLMNDSIKRCPWVDLSKPEYLEYHDKEWGVPVHDDRRLFEFLILEAFQAGLSWYTILKRRESFRFAFDRFDPEKVARYDEAKILELLAYPGIIRNRSKVLAAVNNARRFLEVQEEFGSFDAYIWSFIDNKSIVNELRKLEDYPSKSWQSETISGALRKRGFSFVGPTIIYAHMQATGMVNDHTVDCYRRREIISLAAG